jgi:hypothetical protein
MCSCYPASIGTGPGAARCCVLYGENAVGIIPAGAGVAVSVLLVLIFHRLLWQVFLPFIYSLALCVISLPENCRHVLCQSGRSAACACPQRETGQ